MVELDFSHNNSSYTIKRGIKPNVFEIFKDGELVDQSSYMKDYQNILEECLGLTPATIKQTIILSSRFYTPFLELSASEKREFIETLLGIKIFANMQDLLKVEVSSLKQEEQFIQKDIDKVSSNIKLTKEYIQTNEEQTKINNDEVLKEISLLQVLVESVNKEIEEATSSLSQLQLEYDKYKEAPALKDKFLKLLWHNRSKIEVLLDKNNKLDTNICDNCGQTIDLQYKKKTVDNNNLQL
jgi:DNA repair exonuclease SbcCD ATPase subunit